MRLYEDCKEANRPYGETTGTPFVSRRMPVGFTFGSANREYSLIYTPASF
ncbi:hypothetical protein [Tannerella forsythia]|nr:hypothetical protein [Tannerella forsythia]